MKRLYCAEIDKDHINEEILVCGWVKKIKKMGKLLFLTVGDRTGRVQVIVPENNHNFESAKNLKRESVVKIIAKVRFKIDQQSNIESKTDIELHLNDLIIESISETPPLIVETETDALEDVRMSNRFLDLRRPNMQQNIMFRSRILHSIRNFFYKNGFIEIETPILGKPTPEGARDYLVPSRINHGSFYALPQSPQIYKQLLMVSGFDRYFQIARCFRDEDLRSDRQPEFTQLDIELSFVDELEVQTIIEQMIQQIFYENLNINIQIPFDRLDYAKSIDMYGSDKPDLRFDLYLQNVSDFFASSNFDLFKNAKNNSQVIKAIICDKILQKSEINRLQKYAQDNGAKNLLWIAYDDTQASYTGSLANKLEEKLVTEFLLKNELKTGTILFIVDKYDIANKALGAVRNQLAEILGLKKENDFKFVWIVNWPLFEYNADKGVYVSAHHPFTQPQNKYHENFDIDKENALAKAYDIVLNGFELGGGSIRITNQNMQQRMFRCLGMDNDEIQSKFGYLINAFKYGVPPHGGLAIGIDRLVTLMLNLTNIKDTIAFPKNANAFDQMLRAPSSVNESDLDELGISLN